MKYLNHLAILGALLASLAPSISASSWVQCGNSLEYCTRTDPTLAHLCCSHFQPTDSYNEITQIWPKNPQTDRNQLSEKDLRLNDNCACVSAPSTLDLNNATTQSTLSTFKPSNP